MLDLALIRIDGGTQARVELDQNTVTEYAEAYKTGAEFPPVTVFFDGTDRWLADGFHRYFGAKSAGKTQIYETIVPGTLRDAVLFSLKANATHGLKRSNADKRKAVETLLRDQEWAEWSDRKIAELTGVSITFVGAIRRPEVAQKQQDNKVASAKKQAERCSPTTPPAPESSPPSPQKESEEHYDPREDHLKEAADAISVLAGENEELRARLAVGVMVGTEEEKREAADTIADLRQQVRTLEAELIAVKSSRDHYQREVHEMRKQLKMNERDLKKARAVA